MNNLIKINHYVLGIYVSLYSPYKIVAETKKQILIIPIRKKQPDKLWRLLVITNEGVKLVMCER